ncbi:MAG: hypothetical protein LBH06_00875 [Rikenellaceae bacterium]|jgi:phage gpG-like protein|nr:hypothetical protein [Rikenellaceae bacterium]
MTEQEFRIKFKKQQFQLRNVLNRDAAIVAGKTASDMFAKNFERESWFGKPWQEVQRRMPYNYRNGKQVKNYHRGADLTRPILTGRTAVLRRSIRYKPLGRGGVVVFSDASYASYHNRGAGHMPKRQFIGPHPSVTKAIIREVNRKINSIIKQ